MAFVLIARVAPIAVLVLLTACSGQERVVEESSYDLAATKRCLHHLDAFVDQYSEAERIADELPSLDGTILGVNFGPQGEYDFAYIGLARDDAAAKRYAYELGKGYGSVLFDRIRQHGSVVTWGLIELQPKVERKMLGCVKRG